MTIEEAQAKVKAIRDLLGPSAQVTLHVEAAKLSLGLYPTGVRSGAVRPEYNHRLPIAAILAWGEARAREIASERQAADLEYQSWFAGEGASDRAIALARMAKP